MAKSQKSLKLANSSRKETYRNGVPSGKFCDRNLTAVNPLKEQFEPTSVEPVRQRYKMAGGC